MNDEMPPAPKNPSLIWDLAMLAVIALSGVLGLVEALRPIAIGLGAVAWPVFGFGTVVVMMILNAAIGRSGTGDKDFSSMPPEEERSFIVFEKSTRANAKKAMTIALIVGGVMALCGVLVGFVLYTPCTAFCERAPSTCKGSQIDTWKAGCSNSCSNLEHQSGLTITKPKKYATAGEADAATSQKELETVGVSGTEYVQALNACSFANGAGATCEKIVEKAVSMGLWCPETNK